MNCEECCYYWKDEKETYGRCHFEDNPYNVGYAAPCEEDYWRETNERR